MRLQVETLTVHPARPFAISRATTAEKTVVLVRIGRGVGEAAAYSSHGDTLEGVLAFLKQAEGVLGDDPFDLEGLEQRLHRLAAGHTSAKNAILMALYDHIGQELGVPLYRLLGLSGEAVPTSYTIGLGTPEEMVRDLEAHPEFSVYKIKVGVPGDLELLRELRRHTDKPFRVDANGGWRPKEAVQKIREMADLGVVLVEQPVPPDDLEGLAYVTRHSPIPVIADESVHTSADLPALVGRVDGINIKLAKSGGLREALRMIHIARAFHLRVMLGCMVETSVGITAAAHLASLVDDVDLDGAYLLADDPFEGAWIQDGRIHLPQRPGLGVVESNLSSSLQY